MKNLWIILLAIAAIGIACYFFIFKKKKSNNELNNNNLNPVKNNPDIQQALQTTTKITGPGTGPITPGNPTGDAAYGSDGEPLQPANWNTMSKKEKRKWTEFRNRWKRHHNPKNKLVGSLIKDVGVVAAGVAGTALGTVIGNPEIGLAVGALAKMEINKIH